VVLDVKIWIVSAGLAAAAVAMVAA
jgi:hypothetical protein